MAVLGLRFCARAFSSCGKRGPLFIAMRGPFTVAASPVAEHRFPTHRLSNRGSRAQLLRGMWDLPGPGLEPVSSALAGGFSTTAPPGKPSSNAFDLGNPFLPSSVWFGFLIISASLRKVMIMQTRNNAKLASSEGCILRNFSPLHEDSVTHSAEDQLA